MARKSVQERLTASKQKINPYYDANVLDLNDIVKEGNPFHMICIAFQYGYLQGSKATKKELGAKRA